VGRPRGFDEGLAVAAAAALFGRLSYDGASVDDLVGATGVHRGSLYKTFGSKRGLYLAALRHHVDEDVTRFAEVVAGSADLSAALNPAAERPDLRFLLLAAAERASADQDVAAEVNRALERLDDALRPLLPAAELAPVVTATMLGLLLRASSTTAEVTGTAALLNRLRCMGDRHGQN
jgi:TetR/AcrR family transcriptional regulator, transcriptional repressor for nem operon